MSANAGEITTERSPAVKTGGAGAADRAELEPDLAADPWLRGCRQGKT
jgi:hypothetical protein